MLAQNLTLQCKYEYNRRQITMYIHASVKTQVLIHPMHCITGHAQFMLHSHALAETFFT